MQIRQMARVLQRPTPVHSVQKRTPNTSVRQQQFSVSPTPLVNDPATALEDNLFPGNSPRPPQATPVESRRPNEPADSRNPFLNAFPSAPSASSRDQRDPQRNDLATILRRNLRSSQSSQSGPRPANPMAQIRALENQNFRLWREGDIVAPHDLSPVEHVKARKARQPATNLRQSRTRNTRSKGTKDVFDHLGIDPLKEYKNFAMMSEFISDTGRIKHSRLTGLRGVNQRKMAKAVRRAVGMGLLPSVYKHPELLEERLGERGQGGQLRGPT